MTDEQLIPKPRRIVGPSLGQGAYKPGTNRPRRLSQGEVDRLAHLAATGQCKKHEHVAVAGLSRPVCVLPGQDPEQVAREAAELAGGAS